MLAKIEILLQLISPWRSSKGKLGFVLVFPQDFSRVELVKLRIDLTPIAHVFTIIPVEGYSLLLRYPKKVNVKWTPESTGTYIMSNFSTSLLLLSASLLTLSACETTITPPSGAQYQTTTSTAAVTSPLGGSALRLTIGGVSGEIEALEAVRVGGSLTHNTGRIEIGDGTYLLIDPDGFDAQGRLTDGTANGQRVDGAGLALFSGTYAYVIPFVIDYEFAISTDYLSLGGTIGIVTRASDVPQAGTAQYTGDAFAQVETTDRSTEFLLANGISIVDVDFAAGSVDVTMGLFGLVNGIAGPPTASPVDTISGTGMTIVGASFSGGTWVTLKDGVVVDFTGPGTVGAAGGDFFGYDPSISGPDEVGGVIVMDGSNGHVYGIFVAD